MNVNAYFLSTYYTGNLWHSFINTPIRLLLYSLFIVNPLFVRFYRYTLERCFTTVPIFYFYNILILFFHITYLSSLQLQTGFLRCIPQVFHIHIPGLFIKCILTVFYMYTRFFYNIFNTSILAISIYFYSIHFAGFMECFPFFSYLFPIFLLSFSYIFLFPTMSSLQLQT